MIEIDKDILDVSQGILCHQVNCQRVMGAGLALRIRNKWPNVYKEYKITDGKLGDVGLVCISWDLYVANLYGQDGYGRDKCYTDYNALQECFKKLAVYNKQIYIPKGMGCNLGGGDWNVVSAMIEKYLPKAIICNYHGGKKNV